MEDGSEGRSSERPVAPDTAQPPAVHFQDVPELLNWRRDPLSNRPANLGTIDGRGDAPFFHLRSPLPVIAERALSSPPRRRPEYQPRFRPPVSRCDALLEVTAEKYVAFERQPTPS